MHTYNKLNEMSNESLLIELENRVYKACGMLDTLENNGRLEWGFK